MNKYEKMKLPPEPPIWLGMIISGILGFLFVGAAILLHHLTH
jgi:hypothetical protein